MSDTERIVIDPDSLTIGDLEDFETIVGKELLEVIPTTPAEAANFRPSAKVLKAFIYLAKRRDDPSFTIADASKVRVGALDFGKAADPPEAAS